MEHRQSQGPWTIVKDEQAHESALKLARGSYQRDLLLGHENLSGSTLRGRARGYSSRYARSRDTVLGRLTRAGIPHYERTGENGRRELVIGEPTGRLTATYEHPNGDTTDYSLRIDVLDRRYQEGSGGWVYLAQILSNPDIYVVWWSECGVADLVLNPEWQYESPVVRHHEGYTVYETYSRSKAYDSFRSFGNPFKREED